MNGFSIGELCIIYGVLLLFCVIGILLLLQGYFFRKTFYRKYTLHVKAMVKDKWGSDLNKPVITYVANVNGEEITLVEQSSIGAPFYVPEVGDIVDVYIHPDSNKTVSLLMPRNTKSRVFVCEKRALSMSKFYLGMGSAFGGVALLGIIMFTLTLMS